jgi:hypothetical protein
VDDDVKVRFEELDKRIQANEKRFDDIKWYLGGVLTLGVLVAGWNLSTERTRVDQSLQQMKAEIGKVEEVAELQIFGRDGTPLDGQTIKPEILVDKDETSLTIHQFLRNTGNGSTGPMFVKIYASDPVVLNGQSSDEPRFKYEQVILPKDLIPNEMPGKFAVDEWYRLHLPGRPKPPAGKYDILVRVFYGKGKIAQASFKIAVD